MHALVTAIGPEHLGDQQFASEQVTDGQRGGPALPAGRAGGGPVISINGVTGIERPGRAYRGLEILSRYLDQNPETMVAFAYFDLDLYQQPGNVSIFYFRTCRSEQFSLSTN